MARNGSGTYTRTDGVRTGSTVFQQEAAAAIDIVAVNLDYEAQDMADALTASIANDGQTPILANLPMSNFAHTGVAAASARTQYGRVAEIQDGTLWDANTFGGTVNALTCTLAPVPTAYTRGMRIVGTVSGVNTGSATVNANAIGLITVKKVLAGGKVALTGGELVGQVEFISDGTDLILQRKTETQQGANIASAATVDLGAATGEYVVVTGSTGPITSFGTIAAGVQRRVTFTGTPTLTYNATSLILPSLANITAAAGDNLLAVSLGSGNWRVVSYSRADGSPISGAITLAIVQAYAIAI